MVIPESRAGCSRVTHPFATDQTSKLVITVRLACVKHAASVRPEPESNSPLMSTWHPTTKAVRQPTNETANPPLTKGQPIRFGRIRNPEPHGVRTRLQSQPRPTKRQAIWHRLLGTLLSSQGTDAHPFRPFDLPGGNRSNLAERPLRVKLPVQAVRARESSSRSDSC